MWLKQREWDLVGVAAVAAFVLGWMGFHFFLFELGKNSSFWDSLYFSLRLFLFNYDLPGEGVPYAAPNRFLQCARFLAPATVFYAGIRGFAVMLAKKYEVWAVRNWSGHAVIIGGGKRGSIMAQALIRRKKKLVLVDSDAACDFGSQGAKPGALFLRGDIRDADVQSKARLSTAQLVIAVTGSAEVNLKAAVLAGQSRQGDVRIFCHAPKTFSEVFENCPPFVGHQGGVETHFFDYDSNSARQLVLEYGVRFGKQCSSVQRPSVALIGNTPFLAELACALLTQFQFGKCGAPMLSIIADDRRIFSQRIPLAEPDLLSLVGDVSLKEVQNADIACLDLADLGELPRFDFAFVSFELDLEGLRCVQDLMRHRILGVEQPVLCLRPSHDLATLVQIREAMPGVEIHDLAELGCTFDAVVDGSLDVRAQKIHEAYVQEQVGQDKSFAKNPVLVPWKDLSESYRKANRSQADNIPVKCAQAALFDTPGFLERLAEAEHRRWMADRILAGWRPGDIRDNAKKIHPSIRPYADLTEAEKQKDRDAVASANGFLERSQ